MRVSRSRSGSRDRCPHAMLDGEHDEIGLADCIDNSIVAIADSIEMVFAFERDDAWGARMILNGIEPFHEGLPKRFLNCSELLFGWWGKENGGDHLVLSESQFFQNYIERLSALLVGLG